MRAWILFPLALLACTPRSSASERREAAAPGPNLASPPLPIDRPYGLHVPAGWDHKTPAPLLVVFHGYGDTGSNLVRGFGLAELSDASGFVLAYPDGTLDSEGRRFWNATNACCDFENRGIDDVAYASSILDEIERKLPIDPRRVYVAGHSNGGFMALRLACDLSPRIAATVSIAGAAWKDASRCRPTSPVSVLQVQGDADRLIHYGGGLVFDQPTRDYPGALATLATFADRDHCTGGLSPPGAPLDFDGQEPGSETTPRTYAGCPAGISVTLWTVAGGSHLPHPTRDGMNALWAWMAAHPKP